MMKEIELTHENLLAERQKRNLSIRKMAEVAGVSRSSWSDYESKGIMPTIEKARLIAKNLGVKFVIL